MGLLDFLKKKNPEEVKEKEEKPEEPVSKEVCSACNQPGADKKFGGMWWHKACLRKARKMAKGMI